MYESSPRRPVTQATLSTLKRDSDPPDGKTRTEEDSSPYANAPAGFATLWTATQFMTARYTLAIRTFAAMFAFGALIAAPVSAQTYRIETILGDFDPIEEVALADAWTDVPTAVATDALGNVYFADRETGRVRRVDASGRVSTVAGSGMAGYGGDGGTATQAALERAEALAIDGRGNIYIADTDNYRIRKVDSTGMIALSQEVASGDVAATAAWQATRRCLLYTVWQRTMTGMSTSPTRGMTRFARLMSKAGSRGLPAQGAKAPAGTAELLQRRA